MKNKKLDGLVEWRSVEFKDAEDIERRKWIGSNGEWTCVIIDAGETTYGHWTTLLNDHAISHYFKHDFGLNKAMAFFADFIKTEPKVIFKQKHPDPEFKGGELIHTT